MLKIGINSASRIVPAEVTETQESPVQQNLEQQSTPEAKPLSAANTSIRAETMFSAFAMRSQLTQQLARNESMNINPASLKHISHVDLQAPLTQTEAEQQIENQPTYIKPFAADEASKREFRTRTLNTGDGDDDVQIHWGKDGLVHVDVNGKEAWSGTQKEFSTWTIDTGGGNDSVYNTIDGAKIETGDGNDKVYNEDAAGVQIRTGDGNDSVQSHGGVLGSAIDVDTGSGDDEVSLSRTDRSRVNTGSGNDRVELKNSDENNIDTGSGNDSVYLGHEHYDAWANGNEVNTGSGDDYVMIAKGDNNTVRTENGNDRVRMGRADENEVSTGDGNDSIELSGVADDNKVDTGQGEDEVEDLGEYNRIS